MRTLSNLWIDRAARPTLQDQLARQIRERIRSGDLAPGDPLPSTRDLATELFVRALLRGSGCHDAGDDDQSKPEQPSGDQVRDLLGEDVRVRGAVPAEDHEHDAGSKQRERDQQTRVLAQKRAPVDAPARALGLLGGGRGRGLLDRLVGYRGVRLDVLSGFWHGVRMVRRRSPRQLRVSPARPTATRRRAGARRGRRGAAAGCRPRPAGK